ncbi:MAG: BglG family transcription antiterminator [Clostridium sp.]
MKKTQRWMELLNILVEEQNFQTVAELAEEVAVSSRTIHSDLQDTSFLQLLHGAELIKKPNIGIRLHCTQKQREAIYRQLQKNRFETSVPLEKGNDLHTVLHMLLTYRDAIRMEDLADALYRSKSSLTTVLEEAERLAENYDCRLRKRSNYGLSLEGHEEDIRNLFYRFVDTLPVQGYQHNDLDVRLPDALYEKMKMVFDVQMIRMIIPIVKSSEINLNTHYCDYDFGMLILKCCILLTRCQIDRSVQKQTTISTDLQEYYVATIMKLKMEQTFHVSLPEEEIYYLERVILSTRKQQNQEQFQELDSAMLDRFIYLVSERLNVDLSEDKQLKQNLCNHMKPAIRRMKYGISSENPLLEAIKTKYTEVYVAIMTTIDKIEEREHIYFDANELGFICLHIVGALNRSRNIRSIRCLLICDAGITFESYIKSMVETSFREIEIVNIIGSDEMKKETGHQHDLILNATTNRLHASNIINIDHLFTEASCSQIRHWILQEKSSIRWSFAQSLTAIFLIFRTAVKIAEVSFINTAHIWRITDMLQKRLRRRFMIVFSIHQQQSDVVAVPHGTKKQ